MGKTKQSSSSFWYARRRASSAPATPRPEPADPPPVGCMSMVHYLIFAPGAGCVGRPSSSANMAIVTPRDIHSPLRDGGGDKKKSGFEAPRNSLDLDADNPNDIQIGVQIEPVFDALARTSMRRAKPTAPSSEAETPRTPSLVARLMGIDGLPDHQPSPSPGQQQQHRKPKKQQHAAAVDKENHHCSSAPSTPASSAGSKEKKKRVIPESMNRREPLRSLSCNVVGSSLPETPRGSTTSARASWDGPRLSLQALKENVLDRAAQYMSMPSSPTSSSSSGKNKYTSRRRRRDEKERERVAKEHAREILRQAKENVASRKAKASSSNKTNKSSSSSSPAAEKKQLLMSFFGNKENVAPPPTSPPLALVEDKRVLVQQPAAGNKPKAQGTEHPTRMPLAPRQQQQQHPPPQRAKPSRPPPPLDPPARARKPDGCERFATRIKKPSSGGGGGQPAAPATSPAVAKVTPAPATSSAAPVLLGKQNSSDPEYSYVRSVLERGGFMRSPPPRRPKHDSAWPVDPIVFHLLELELPADEAALGPLRHRWNRKLLFHLTQELLAEDASDAAPAAMTGPPLLGSVWRKVRSFPAADCRVVGDIDALVAADIMSSSSSSRTRRRRRTAEEEEAGAVAAEVAERVLETLLGECVAESLSLSCAAAPGGLTWSSSSSRAQAAR